MGKKIEVPIRPDLHRYAQNLENPEVYFGLPPKVEYCKRCVISNQRPNSAIEYQHTEASSKVSIFFDDNGVCDACNFAEKKQQEIDWSKREFELRQICNKFRSRNGSYDCIVPGSGGKDSFYASHLLKYKFDMNPLTVTWAPHLYTDWGKKNFYSWLDSGFDNYLMTPNSRVHRLLTRLSTELLFHPFQPFMIGQKSLAPKMALLHDIPLVFYGENESEYGNPISDTSSAERDNMYFSNKSRDNIYLGGVSIEELKSDFGLSDPDLSPYLPANTEDIIEKGVQVHYLGYYLKWHPQNAYYYAVENGNFIASPERTPGTYSKYNSIDDKIDDLHYFTTGIKFGIGRATYDAAQEIRSGDIDRDEGVALVDRFDHEMPWRFFTELMAYLTVNSNELPNAANQFEEPIMNEEYFELLTNKFRSPHIWQFDNSIWSLRKKLS